ncbi:MAG: hypothetical protein AMXMBFR84_06030 [Candidatus Hydrogenedentota bacterium]
MRNRCNLIWIGLCLTVAPAWAAFVNFETPHVHPIDISPDGATVAVTNTPAGLLYLYDVTSGTPVWRGTVQVGLDPVTVRFRTNTEAWVVNHISDSVSIVNTVSQRVVDTISTLDEPCDVVFAGSPVLAFVSCSQANAIQRFNPADRSALPVTIPILGEDPRSLAVSPDGMTIYAAIFESGNGSTIIAGGADGTIAFFPPMDALNDAANPYAGVNPPPNDPNDTNSDSNLFIPPKAANGTPPRVGLIVKKDAAGVWRDDNGANWTPWITGAKAAMSGRYTGWDVIDHDVAVLANLNAATPTVNYADRLMNICMSVAVNPATGNITVIGTDGTNEIRFEPVISGTFLRVNLGIVDASNLASATIVDLNAEHLALAQPGGVDPYETHSVSQANRNKSIGDPRGIVWNAAGTRAYITGMGSNNLVVVDATGNRVTTGSTTELREGPTGAVLSADESRLFVVNRFHASISVVDTATLAEIANVPYFDPTPTAIRTGRKHLYDTHKNSGLGHIACASCHVDARMDRLAWDLGDPAGSVKLLSAAGNPPKHNLGAGIPGLLHGGTSPAFENFHPMKGPMTTQTLQDIIGKEPFHWRGDRDGLEEFNPAFVGLQGDDAMLTPQEMQEFEDFLATTHFPPNPFRNLDNSLPTDLPLPGQFANGRFALPNGAPLPNGNAVDGLSIYRDQSAPLDSGNFTCVVCHTLPVGDGTNAKWNGTTFASIPPGPMGERHVALVSVDGSTNRAIKIPQLRNQYDKAGFELTPGNPSLSGFGVLHDGSIDSIARFVSEPVFQVTSDQDVADLTALVLAFSGGFDDASPNPGPAPEPPGNPNNNAPAAIGRQVTIDNPSDSLGMVTQLILLANTGQVDLIAKGTVNGFPRGWRYIGSNQFSPDSSTGSVATLGELVASTGIGSEITFQAVMAGSGTTLGINRDDDGVLDFDEFLLEDNDGDGVANGSESGLDTDSDGLKDYLDKDSNNDGVNDGVPVPSGTISVRVHGANATWMLSGTPDFGPPFGPQTYFGNKDLANITTGTYTVTWSTLIGFNSPPNQPDGPKTVAQGGTTLFEGTYTAITPPDPPPTRKSAIEHVAFDVREEILPLDREAGGLEAIHPMQPLYLRLTADEDIDPDSVSLIVEGDAGYRGKSNSWWPVDESKASDGWAVFAPVTPYGDGEALVISAGARTISGEIVATQNYTFAVSASAPAPTPSTALVTASEVPAIDLTVAYQVGSAFRTLPEAAFLVPLTVQLPVPEGEDASALEVWYYSDSARHPGWYPVSAIAGLCLGHSSTVIVQDREYIQININHSATLALAVPAEVPLASFGRMDVAARGSAVKWIWVGLLITALVMAASQLKHRIKHGS